MSENGVPDKRRPAEKKPQPKHDPRKLNTSQLKMFEDRLEALGERLGLVDCGPCDACRRDWAGHWGDVCAALLPEVFGPPSKLPEEPCNALPGSKRRLATMAERFGPKPLLVAATQLF